MVYIPFDIILFEILIRLNGRFIDQYKCVCKQWNEGLSSWPFEWLYVNYANAYLESFWEDCPTLYVVLYKEYFPPESKRNKIEEYEAMEEDNKIGEKNN
ncbi:putative F-box-like domain superfamily protein [Helianthus anomalus]